MVFLVRFRNSSLQNGIEKWICEQKHIRAIFRELEARPLSRSAESRSAWDLQFRAGRQHGSREEGSFWGAGNPVEAQSSFWSPKCGASSRPKMGYCKPSKGWTTIYCMFRWTNGFAVCRHWRVTCSFASELETEQAAKDASMVAIAKHGKVWSRFLQSKIFLI